MQRRRRILVHSLVAVLATAVLPLLFAAAASALPQSGENLWAKVYSSGQKTDAFFDVARGPGNVYYCTGVTRGTEESSLLLLVKYRADGTRLWARSYKAPGRVGARGDVVQVDRDGDVLVAGSIGQAPSVADKFHSPCSVIARK